jgi:hypothetical protein
MDYDRGPSDHTEMPLGERVVTEGLFLNLAGDLVQAYHDYDSAFGYEAGVYAELATWRTEPAFNAYAVPVFDGIESIGTAAEQAQLGDMVYAGSQADWDASNTTAQVPGPFEQEPVQDKPVFETDVT